MNHNTIPRASDFFNSLLVAEIELYFDGAPKDETECLSQTEKAHGRIETRRHLVSQRIDWMSGKRR
jgi:hypothetical protein